MSKFEVSPYGYQVKWVCDCGFTIRGQEWEPQGAPELECPECEHTIQAKWVDKYE